MDDHSLQLRVIYEDLPDLIELGVSVIHGAWSAVATAYTSPSFFIESGEGLLRGSKHRASHCGSRLVPTQGSGGWYWSSILSTMRPTPDVQ